MIEFWKLPCASVLLISYRYNGPYGFIMVGARTDQEALQKVNRSLEVPQAIFSNLEKWNGKEYEFISV